MENNSNDITYDEILYYLDLIESQKNICIENISKLSELEYKVVLHLLKKYHNINDKKCIKNREREIKRVIGEFKYRNNSIENKRRFINKYETILNYDLNKRSNTNGECFINEEDASKYHIKELEEIVQLISHAYPSSVHELAKKELKRTK